MRQKLLFLLITIDIYGVISDPVCEECREEEETTKHLRERDKGQYLPQTVFIDVRSEEHFTENDDDYMISRVGSMNLLFRVGARVVNLPTYHDKAPTAMLYIANEWARIDSKHYHI